MKGGCLEGGRISGIDYRFHRIGKAIPIIRKAYRAMPDKQVRWEGGAFEHPWLVENPGEVGFLVDLLRSIGEERSLRLAMKPTGIYGNVLRQALSDAGLSLERVGTKAARDHAAIFDGVPRRHKGRFFFMLKNLISIRRKIPR